MARGRASTTRLHSTSVHLVRALAAFLRKRHHWLTNSAAVTEVLAAQCPGDYLHTQVQDVEMKRSIAYTPLLACLIIAALSMTFPIVSLQLCKDMEYVWNA